MQPLAAIHVVLFYIAQACMALTLTRDPHSLSAPALLPGSLCAVLCRRPFNPTHSVPAAIHCLCRLLRERSVRVLFQRVSGSVQLLAPLLRSNASATAPNQQLLYEAGMCVWQLTFYEPAAQAMGSSGVVQGLVDMARSATKEKVSRQSSCSCIYRQER